MFMKITFSQYFLKHFFCIFNSTLNFKSKHEEGRFLICHFSSIQFFFYHLDIGYNKKSRACILDCFHTWLSEKINYKWNTNKKNYRSSGCIFYTVSFFFCFREFSLLFVDFSKFFHYFIQHFLRLQNAYIFYGVRLQYFFSFCLSTPGNNTITVLEMKWKI